MPSVETHTRKVTGRLIREGWTKPVLGMTKFAHPAQPGSKIIVPRHRILTPGVARAIARAAGWI